jgi:hypothetical protein
MERFGCKSAEAYPLKRSPPGIVGGDSVGDFGYVRGPVAVGDASYKRIPGHPHSLGMAVATLDRAEDDGL